MNNHKHIILQCESAIEAVKTVLSEKEYKECIDYIQHHEWLLSLEFAIDWLTEDERKITLDAYENFLKAYTLMGKESDHRIKDLNRLADQ